MASQAVDIEGGWGRLGARQQAADRIARMPGGRVEAALLRLDLAWDRLDLLDRWTEPDTRPDLPGEGLRAALIAARDEAASALGDAGQPEEAARVVATADPWTCALDEVRALGMQQALMVEQAAATLGRAQADPGDAEGFAAAVLRFVRIKEHVFRTERYVLASLRPGSDPRQVELRTRQIALVHDLAIGLAHERHTLAEHLQVHGDPAVAARWQEALRDGVRAWLRWADDAALCSKEARMWEQAGRYDLALRMADEALDRLAGLDEPAALVEAYTARAELWSWLGDHHRAREEALLAGRQLERLTAAPAPAVGGEGVLGWLMGAATRGLQSIARSLEHERLRQGIVHVKCHSARQLGLWEEARAELTALRAATPAHVRFAIDWQLAEVLLRSGHPAEAARLAAPLPAAAEGSMGSHKMPLLLQTLGEAMIGAGQREGLDVLRRARAMAVQSGGPREAWRTGAALGDALARTGSWSEALTVWREAARAESRLRAVPLGHRLDSTRLRAVRPVFDRAIRVAAHLGDADAAFELIELVKARGLHATLSAPAAPTAEAADHELVAVSAALDAVYRQTSDLGWTPERQAAVERLRRARAELVQRVRLRDPRWHALTEPVKADPARVDALLRRTGCAALDLFDLGDRVVTVLRDEQGGLVDSVPISSATRAALLDWAAWVRSPRPEPPHRDPAEDWGLAADAFVPASLLARALRARQVVIAPHGQLHLLPWGSLDWDGQRLFEHAAISVTPSLGLLPLLAARFSSAPTAALFGAPAYGGASGLTRLVGAKVELERLEALHGGTAPITGHEATEAAWWAMVDALDARTILHVACHGHAPEDDPLAAGLALTDGRVEAEELLRWRCPGLEIVLSACSTGQRPIAVDGVELLGDDVLGLPGAWLEAGARAVLVSIPAADDLATEALMVAYHEARLAGRPPALALQQAQRTLLADGRWEAARWTGFTLYGGVHLD